MRRSDGGHGRPGRKRRLLRVQLALVALFGAVFISVVGFAPVARASQADLPAAPAPGPQEVEGPVSPLPDGAFPPGLTVVAELPGLRTADSRTYVTSTGSRVLMSYPGPINYKDSSGAFEPIDDSAVGSSGGWHNIANAYQATVGSTPVQPVSVTSGSATLSLALVGAGTESSGLLPPGAVTGAASGDSVQFAQVFSDANLSSTFGNTGLDEALSLTSKGAPDTYTWSLDPSDGLHATMTPGGAIAFDASDGTTAMVIDAPSIEDANHLVGPPPTLALSPDGTTMTMSLAGDAAWLADPARAFPVTVDPSVTTVLNGGSECQMYSYAPTTSECASGTAYQIGSNSLGGDIHSMFRLDNLTNEIPYDSLVQNASFSVYEQGSLTNNSIPVSLGTIADEDWSPSQATWNDYASGQPWANPGGDATPTPGTVAQNAGTANGWLSWDPVQQAQAWVNGEDLSSPSSPPPTSVNQGFLLTAPSGAANTAYVTNWASSSTSQWPYLAVQYTPRTGTGSGLDVEKTPLDDKTTLGVNVANGDLSVDTSLFSINGVGLPLAIDQDYDSRGATETSLGTGNEGAAWALSPSFDQPQVILKYSSLPGVAELVS